MVTPVDTTTQPAEPEIVIQEAALPAPEVDSWAEFDGITPGTPVEETPAPAPTPEAEAKAAPVAGVETPPTKATEPPITEPAPVLDPRIQQELVTLRSRIADSEAKLVEREGEVLAQQDFAQFNTAVVQRQKQLEEQTGLTADVAQGIAQREIGAAWRAYQAEKNAVARIAQAEAKIEVAIKLAEQHKIPLSVLRQYQTLPAMLAGVEQWKAQNTQAQEIADLKAQVAKLTKTGVPSQTFAQGVTGGGGPTVTSENIDALYMQNPARYEAAYRKFLANSS